MDNATDTDTSAEYSDKTVDKTSSIDRAIAAAKARKEAKAANAATNGDAPSDTPTPKRTKTEKVQKTEAEKAAEAAQKEADRLERKRVRDAEREARRAEKEANKKAPHMSKVVKAAARLPELDDRSAQAFNDITTNFTREQISALQAHLMHFNRVKATESSLGQKLAVGDEVRIVSGDTKFTGRTGTVVKVQRIRCYVEVTGVNKPVYLFTSDVQKYADASADAGASAFARAS